MSDLYDLLDTLWQRLKQLPLMGVLAFAPASSLAGAPSTDVHLAEAMDHFASGPASCPSAAERLQQEIAEARHMLETTMALLADFQTRNLGPHECSYLRGLRRILDDTPTTPDALRPRLGALATHLRAAIHILLSGAPNAGDWYRLVDVIAPGSNPPVPQRYIGTVELSPLSVDWRGIEADLWVEDISRQFDGAR